MRSDSYPRSKSQNVALWLVVIAFTVTGMLHFIRPSGFVKIVPDYLGHALTLVYVSGVFELLGAAGMLVPRYRRAAAYGLVLLLIAVFPANVFMLTNPAPVQHFPKIVLWIRLAFQPVFVFVVWLAGIERGSVAVAERTQ